MVHLATYVEAKCAYCNNWCSSFACEELRIARDVTAVSAVRPNADVQGGRVRATPARSLVVVAIRVVVKQHTSSSGWVCVCVCAIVVYFIFCYLVSCQT